MFAEYLQCLDTVLGPGGDTAVNKTDINPCPTGADILEGRQKMNKTHRQLKAILEGDKW